VSSATAGKMASAAASSSHEGPSDDDELEDALALSTPVPKLVQRLDVEKLELVDRILSRCLTDPIRFGSINLGTEKATRLLDASAKACLRHVGFEPQGEKLVLSEAASDISMLVGCRGLISDALVSARAQAADPLLDESVAQEGDEESEELRQALALSRGEDPGQQRAKWPRATGPSPPPPNELRKGQDFMFRSWSALEVCLLGPETLQKLQAIMEALTAPGFSWSVAKFEEQGLDDHYLETGWDFVGGVRVPPPPELRIVEELVTALLDQLGLFHTGDAIIPMRCFVNLYRNGGNSVPAHVHHCRQLTMSLGAMRVFTARGPGGFPSALAQHVDAGGALRLPMRSGDVVMCDGQAHGVERTARESAESTGPRVSINIFYHTAHDEMSNRSGRGPIEITTPSGDDPTRPRWRTNCYCCGYDGHLYDECRGAPLPEDWND